MMSRGGPENEGVLLTSVEKGSMRVARAPRRARRGSGGIRRI